MPLALVLAGCTSSSPHQPMALDAAGIVACDRVFVATYERCGGPRLAPAERTRVLALFENVCRNWASMPGSTVTAEVLQQCADTIERLDCKMSAPVCVVRGTLPPGAPCFDDAQCAAGYCDGQQVSTPAGPFGPIKCGTCGTQPIVLPTQEAACTSASCETVAAGASCAGDGDCAPGLACLGATERHCAAIEWVEPDQLCDETRRCRVGACGGYGIPSFALTARCPSVIPDGEPCTGYPERLSTCDTFSQCLDGTCTPIGDGGSCLQR